MKRATRLTLALLALLPAFRAVAAPALVPFVIEYDVRYGSFASGSSRTELSRSSIPGRWFIESDVNAHGFARLIVTGTISFRSIFELEGTAVRPVSYRLDDGTAKTDRDVSLDFDWRAGLVTGTAEQEPVIVEAEPGLQDAISIQAAVQAKLRSGGEPGEVAMIERDKVKRYRFTLLRREKLKTAIGTFDTIVYRSMRDVGGRETLQWFAPALGYAVVQAEQRKDGKRLYLTTVRRYEERG